MFSGIECDILRDGAMDLANDALAELDIVIGSVHSLMNLEPAEMTDRLLRALECPSLRVLGHLTGRMLLHREGYQFDFEKVAAKAASARRVAGDQRQSGAAGHLRTAAADGEGEGLQVHDLDGCASSEASTEHAIWRVDGPAGVADRGRT